MAAADVVAPRISDVALSGVDRSVLRTAPAPHDHQGAGAGTLEALGVHADDLRPAVAASVSTTSRPAELVAVTADTGFPTGTTIQVRVQERTGWSDWQVLGVEDGHGPDPGSVEARTARVGSDPLMTVDATKVQVRIDTPTGRVPAGTGLALVDAPSAASDAVPAPSPTLAAQSTTTAQAAVPRPGILTRAQWGADESWRSRAPIYTDNIRAGFLHHTASTSSYTKAQAPAQIRAIYAYHTKSLGHSDIDYNYVVDRFGQLYEGRAGGIERPVLGGHTAGFNEHTFAVVALGNFQSTAPDAVNLAAIKSSVARLFAWKLSMYGVNPASLVKLVSAGYTKPTKYAKGVTATIPAVSSHQTVNYTSCPGQHLQSQLGSIRALAARYAHVVLGAPSPGGVSFQAGTRRSVTVTSSADRALSWRADVLSPCSPTPVRSYTGRIRGAGQVPVTWDLRDSRGAAVLPATYTIRLTGTAEDGSPVMAVGSRVTISPAPGGAWGPCANVTRMAGTGPAATSVLWARAMAPATRTVVLTAPATDSAAALAASAVAGPLARHLGAALLLTPKAALAGEVAAELTARRAASVLVVGSAEVVSDAVVRAVRALGVPVTRLAGSTPAATAAAVAARFPAGSPAVLVTPAAPAHTLAGAALAGARDVPLLLASGTSVPTVTRSALAARRTVTVVAPTTLSDRTVRASLAAGARWDRRAGVDEVAAGAAATGASPASTQRVVVLPNVPAAWSTAGLAAATGAPLLFTSTAGLSSAVSGVVGARPSLRAVLTPVPLSALSDGVLGAASRTLRGAPWAPGGSTTAPPAPFRLGRTNATPEPVVRGGKLTLKASVKVPDGAGGWRAAPPGQQVVVQFRRSGASGYTAVLRARTTKAGQAKVTVTASRTGRWRLVVGGVRTKSDHVVVRR